jgi:biopolymer transport protein ExbD
MGPARLGIGALLAVIACCGEVPGPERTPEVPPSGRHEPEFADRITVNIRRNDAVAAATTRSADLSPWLISVSGFKYSFDREGRQGLPGIRRLIEALSARGQGRPESLDGPDSPSARLIIRVDEGAPFAAFARVLEAALKAGFVHIELGSQLGAKVPVDGSLPRRPASFRLGSFPQPPFVELPVRLEWEPGSGDLRRSFDGRAVKATPDGDRVLETLMRAAIERYPGDPRSCALAVDSAQDVPWSHVVGVVNLARGLGIERIEFDVGSNFK